MNGSAGTQNSQFDFDPRQFPGLFIWNDAQAVTGTNGVALTSNVWANRAADTTYASSCSTTATYQTNVLNGYPVMQFTTAQTYNFHNTVVTANDFSFFFVSRLTGTTNSRIFQSSNLNILYGYWGGYKNALYLQNNPSILTAAPAIVANANWDLYSFTRKQTQPYTWYTYGSNLSMGTASTGPAFSGLSINTGAFPAEDSTAQVAEILCYSNALTLEQVRVIEGYLAWKWGLQTSLLVGHPYRSARPPCRFVSPNDMQNTPILWFDAAYSPYITLSGNSIVTWSNLGCNGCVLRPWVSGVQMNVNFLNGQTVANFPLGTALSTNVATNCQARSYYFVTRIVNYNATNQFTSFYTQNQSNQGVLANTYINVTTGRWSQGPAGKTNCTAWDTTTTSNNWQIAAMIDNQNTSFNVGTENGSNRSLVVNTVQSYGVAAGQMVFNVPGYNTSYDIAETFLFDAGHTPAERQMMEGLLAWKWGRTTSLPSLHPFRTLRPIFPKFNPLNVNTSNTTSTGRGPLQCVLWLDASQETGANGAVLNSITDKSGSGYTFTCSAAGGATLQTPGRNGLSVYNIGANRLSTSAFVWNTKFTTFIVSQTNGGFFLYSQHTAATGYFNYIYSGNWALMSIAQNAFSANDSVIAQGTSVTGGPWSIFCLGYNNGTQGTPYRVNGTVRTTQFGNVAGVTTYTQPLWINGNAGGASDVNVLIGEILHYNDNLTAAQVSKVEGYLAWKWGLAGSLPQFHPYKTFAP
jgi:hypothetical protein